MVLTPKHGHAVEAKGPTVVGELWTPSVEATAPSHGELVKQIRSWRLNVLVNLGGLEVLQVRLVAVRPSKTALPASIAAAGAAAGSGTGSCDSMRSRAGSVRLRGGGGGSLRGGCGGLRGCDSGQGSGFGSRYGGRSLCRAN